MKKELTPWFPGDVKPVRVGVYERDIGDEGRYAFWNGDFWGQYGMRAGPLSEAVLLSKYRSSLGIAPWRGLASDPEAK